MLQIQQGLQKYDQQVYQILMDSFDTLPVSCIVNNKFFVVHGGISPELQTFQDIQNKNRFQQIPKNGIICDLLWSDPVDNQDGIKKLLGYLQQIFKNNSVRNCSYNYGYEAVKIFIERNNFLCIIRAHQVQPEGYKINKWGGYQEFPSVITIFSAPNYCDVYKNKGAIIKLSNNTFNVKQFNYTAHPYILPNFMDVFTWSIPFVAQKITQILQKILTSSNPDQFQIQEDFKETDKNLLKNKIKAISRLLKMQNILRKESETIAQLKGLSPDNKIPVGLLLEGKEALQNALLYFYSVKQKDLINQRRPYD